MQRGKVYCIDPGTEKIVKVYSSARAAARILDLDYSHINACCRRTRKTTGGYLWLREKDPNLKKYSW